MFIIRACGRCCKTRAPRALHPSFAIALRLCAQQGFALSTTEYVFGDRKILYVYVCMCTLVYNLQNSHT